MTKQTKPAETIDGEPGLLQDLLIKACPPDIVRGHQSVAILAEHMDLTREAVRLWCKDGRIPYGRAKAICALDGAGAELSEFEPFMY